MAKALPLLIAMSLTACLGGGDDDAVVPDLAGGKADVIDQVDDLGDLQLGVGQPGAFTEDLEFHGYHLSVRDGARLRVEITQLGTAKKLDTTLFVYGPGQGGSFGTEALAFDDDAGWGKQSRLTGLTLEGGEYLVVVGTHDARGRGHYRLLATCENGDCAPEPEPSGCDELVANNILNCVAIQVADSAGDPEEPALTRAEALEICTDGEALGPIFDNLCLGPAPAEFCAAGFDAFAQTMGPQCAEDLAPFAVDCVFGEEYRDLSTSHDIVTGARRVLTLASDSSEIESQQVIAAVVSSAADNVSTVAEAFEAADGGEINQTELWDRTSALPYVVYEFGAGDTSVGAYFAHGTTERVAVISDGFLERCSAAAGPQGQDCTSNEECGVGVCMGDSSDSPVGRCTVLSGFGDQADCSVTDPCDIDQGLVCAGLSRGDDGICFPAWMRGNFDERELSASIPDGDTGGLTRTLLVYGLATVDMDVELDLSGFHPDPSQLRVTLENPAGNEALVFDGDGDLHFSGPVSGFSGDESINGLWTLRVVDATGGQVGVLDGWSLRLGSRFD
jgi:hypothetical protein